jgi:hypothetical protein
MTWMRRLSIYAMSTAWERHLVNRRSEYKKQISYCSCRVYTPFTIEINRANSVLGSVMVSLATQYLDDLDKYNRYRGGNSQ